MFDYIKNNSYITLGDGGHIRIVWSCSNAVKTHNFLYISWKKFDNWSSNCQTLIKYNSNNPEENDEEEKEPINIELTEQKSDPYNNENAIDFK